jgi:hypothetical protein
MEKIGRKEGSYIYAGGLMEERNKERQKRRNSGRNIEGRREQHKE